MEKCCINCWTIFEKKYNCSKKSWETVKFCSKVCYTSNMQWKDCIWSNRFKWEPWNKWKQVFSIRWENHPNYKDGWIKRIERHTEMWRIEYILWRKACMERDNFTCKKYWIHWWKLEVHHVNNYKDFPELRTSISNWITLSKQAHKEFHKKYWKRNNTKKQIEEFLESV